MKGFWDENEGADVCINYDLTVIYRKSSVSGAFAEVRKPAVDKTPTLSCV